MNTSTRTPAYDFNRRSGRGLSLGPSNAQSFIGNDGASLMNDLHVSGGENSIQGVPGGLNSRRRFGQRGLDELMNPATIDKAQDWTQKITGWVKLAGGSVSQVFSQLGDITNLGINKTASNPLVVTIAAAGLGLVMGLKSLKNITHGIKVAVDPKADHKLGWIPHEILGLLQGGLFFGLTSSFFGKRNFLTEFQDGKPVVKINSIIGLALACLGFGSAMNLAKGPGNSVLAKIPFIGPALQQIFEVIFGAAKELTVPTESNPNAAEHGAGMPG